MSGVGWKVRNARKRAVVGGLRAKPQLAKDYLHGACSLTGAKLARPDVLHVTLQRAEASIGRRDWVSCNTSCGE